MSLPSVSGNASTSVSQPARSGTIAQGGIVAAAHPLATLAGIDVLRQGGNAMDAAIAAALTTTVTMPSNCGLGGDAFLIYYEARTGKVTALNGSGIAPRTLSRQYFTSRGYDKMPLTGPLSPGVPGAVSVYFEAMVRWSTLPASDLFQYAIHYAESGYPLSSDGARSVANAEADFARYASSASIFLPGGRLLRRGDVVRQTELAQSLRILQQGGPEAFYQGELAERIVAGMQNVGGELRLDDMASQTAEVYEPISTSYRGYEILQTTLPSQGHILLEELNILENADLASMGHNSSQALHLMIEAKKRAFADRNAYSRDPLAGDVPLETLISKSFAADRYASIDPNRATETEIPGAIPEMDGDTTYLCAADAEGNMVSLIHSLSGGFGCRVIAGDTGIFLNNRVGRGFSLEENHPNVIEGGKRTMHTLNAYAVAQNGEVIMVGGTPGGDRQVQWNMQVLTNLIDFGMDVQSAVEAPRWQSFPGTDPQNLPHPFELNIESRVPVETLEELRRRGHRINVLEPYAVGGAAFVIARNPVSGILDAGSDPRSEGGALGI